MKYPKYYILTKGTHLSDIMSYIVLNKNVLFWSIAAEN